MSPIIPVVATVRVEYLSSDILKNEYMPTHIVSAEIIVRAAGKHLLTILLNKFPFIFSRLDSSASINDGMPIVIALMSVI